MDSLRGIGGRGQRPGTLVVAQARVRAYQLELYLGTRRLHRVGHTSLTARGELSGACHRELRGRVARRRGQALDRQRVGRAQRGARALVLKGQRVALRRGVHGDHQLIPDLREACRQSRTVGRRRSPVGEREGQRHRLPLRGLCGA